MGGGDGSVVAVVAGVTYTLAVATVVAGVTTDQHTITVVVVVAGVTTDQHAITVVVVVAGVTTDQHAITVVVVVAGVTADQHTITIADGHRRHRYRHHESPAMSPSAIALIVGLGNPGDRYTATRHNAGFRFVAALDTAYGIPMAAEKRWKAIVGGGVIGGRSVRIMLPQTMMNLSGQAVAPLAAFYRISPAQILVVHDELDLPPGCIRLKRSGGHGGHNGLRDLISRLGGGDFPRLRIGIGHPGGEREVSGYVLGKPPASDAAQIDDAIDRGVAVIDDIVAGEFDAAMNRLHGDA